MLQNNFKKKLKIYKNNIYIFDLKQFIFIIFIL